MAGPEVFGLEKVAVVLSVGIKVDGADFSLDAVRDSLDANVADGAIEEKESMLSTKTLEDEAAFFSGCLTGTLGVANFDARLLVAVGRDKPYFTHYTTMLYDEDLSN